MINNVRSVTFVDEQDKHFTSNNEFFVSQDGPKVSVRVKAPRDMKLKAIRLSFETHPLMKQKMISNGYQSWTEGKRLGRRDRIKPLFQVAQLFNLDKYGDYHFYKPSHRTGDIFSHEFTVFNGEKEHLMVSSLNAQKFYVVFERSYHRDTFIAHLDVAGLEVKKDDILDVGTYYFEVSKDEAVLYDTFASYTSGNREPGEICNGWTSWYNYYTNIDNDIIHHNIEALSESPIQFDVFQIDDGYQKAVGDWMNTNDKFEDDLLPIVEKAVANHMKPGLWLAPFICEKTSFIYLEKKDWLLKDDKGKPLVVGFNPGWSGNFYGLDIYNEEVRAYLRAVFTKVFDEWSFELVKLDFLYAVNILPRVGKTRAMVMKDALDFLDEVCTGEILGCGIPIGSAMGNVEYCRIGADVAPYWEDKKLRFVGYRERVSTRAAIYNTLNRYNLNGRFFSNDPDVFIIREDNNKLSEDEKYTLFMVNQLLGDLVFFSDDISLYDSEHAMIQSANPIPRPSDVVISEEDDLYQIKCRVNEHQYTAYVNMSDETQIVVLDRQYYYSKKTGFITNQEKLSIKPHESYLFFCFDELSVDIQGLQDGYIIPTEAISSYRVIDGHIIASYVDGYTPLGSMCILSKEPLDLSNVVTNTILGNKVGSYYFYSII
ncbi:MAG: alpha-galactosidase [Vallitaleaceae bacterium]|jgi:uncharacterized pyridoxamine 5'-phosphate oxidase family protein|nr:alpha-galactosidase [Vallitaleaceae bacterium]